MNDNNSSMIWFLAISFTVICSGFVYFYIQFLPDPQRAVKCTGGDISINFIINDKERSIVMDGDVLPLDVVSVFDKAIISAKWLHDDKVTKMYLDRISGDLEINTKKAGLPWEKEILKCSNAAGRF